MPVKTDITVTTPFLGGLLAGAAVFIGFLVAVLTITDNVRNSDDNKARERIAEVEACANIEHAAERTLCLWDD